MGANIGLPRATEVRKKLTEIIVMNINTGRCPGEHPWGGEDIYFTIGKRVNTR
jgi:hypothetical protein